jgi:hypothetical protein
MKHEPLISANLEDDLHGGVKHNIGFTALDKMIWTFKLPEKIQTSITRHQRTSCSQTHLEECGLLSIQLFTPLGH